MAELKELEHLVRQEKISRREFLTRTTALGLSAAVLPALWPRVAKATTPKPGGRLRIGATGGSTTDSMDPGTLTSNMNECLNWQIRNNLVELDHKFNPMPELAESWEASADAAQWRFKLRQGVEFHNGKTLDAQDVIDTMNHHRGENSKSGAKSLLSPIVDIQADGKYTVVFTLKGGSADFPFILADYHLPIAPTGTQAAQWEEGIGTGGYILKKHEPGVRAFTQRNPNYWKAGRAHFDEIETLSIVDINARTNALKTGRIDFMDRVELKTVHLLKRVPGIEVTQETGTTHFSAPMLCDHAPYDNNDVRLALKYAVDREQLLDKILRGYGVVGNDHPIGANQRYHATELPQRTYDPDKARFHIKKAGLQGHTFKLHAAEAAFNGATDAAVLFKEHASKCGIKIDVVQEPSDGYWSNVWIKKPWCMCYWGGRATEDWMFSTAYAADTPWNDSKWKHDRFNQLLVAARAELNSAKRRDMYLEMQSIVRDEGGVVIPVFADIVEACSTKLGHGPIAANMELDGMRVAERWWFKA